MSIVLMRISLDLNIEYVGLGYWANHHKPLFILNEVKGPSVMTGVLAIIFFIGLSMVLMYKSFTLYDNDIPL
jgi:hypothetical protein